MPYKLRNNRHHKFNKTIYKITNWPEYNQALIKNDNGKRYPRDVLYFKTAESEGKTYHKTQKPIALCEYMINTYTNESELVLDNCIGSGTTAIACINTKRKFIGFENDNTYFELATKRIEEHKCKINI